MVWCLFIFFLKKVNKYQKSLFMKSGKLEIPLNLTVEIAGSLTWKTAFYLCGTELSC